jgi:hypothetical protein
MKHYYVREDRRVSVWFNHRCDTVQKVIRVWLTAASGNVDRCVSITRNELPKRVLLSALIA